MATAGNYVYGLIRTTEDRDFGCIGLEHEGKPGRVATVRVDEVAAVVSEYKAREKVLPLRKNLEPHHRVIREVMKTTTILPTAFGHVAENVDEVIQTLYENRDDICAGLDRVDGKVEMGLKVKWDVDSIFEHFLATDPLLAALRDQIFGRSHAPTQAEKIELGRRFEERLEQEREEQTERVISAFRSCFSEVKVNPPKNEKAIMDVAFLVERERLQAFEEQVYQVAGTFPAQYLFDYGGPWAPFNFVELDLRKVAA
jgi:gas vesicle protein GvpL/GvpF